MTCLASLVLAYMERHHRGRENVSSREEIFLKYVHCLDPDMGDRTWRRLYGRELPVCSCDDGLFVPNFKDIKKGREEVDEYRRYLAPKNPPWIINEKIERIYRFYPKLRPEPEVEQGRLFG